MRETIATALERGLKVNLYLEDWSNGYRDNPDYVYGFMDRLADLPVGDFMLPDTLGVMTPDQVRAAFADMMGRFPGLAFDFHPHNDYGLATANVMAAAQAGAAAVHCTVNCLGERAGNASLAEVVVNLRDQLGLTLGIDETHLARVSELVDYFSGKRIADNAPIVGADVFTQTAGIHADGDKKAALYQTRLSPERFARRRKYALGKLAGKASLAKNLERLDISLSAENQRKGARAHRRAGRLQDESSPPRTCPSSSPRSWRARTTTTASCSPAPSPAAWGSPRPPASRSASRARSLSAAGSGNGGFDAFINALTKVLKKKGLTLPELIDFEVRIPKGGRTDALTECIITWDDNGSEVKTRGVHANQVFAAINATLRMLNILLHRQAQGAA